MSRDCCLALPRAAMGLSAFVIVVFPDHTYLLFLHIYIKLGRGVKLHVIAVAA